MKRKLYEFLKKEFKKEVYMNNDEEYSTKYFWKHCKKKLKCIKNTFHSDFLKYDCGGDGYQFREAFTDRDYKVQCFGEIGNWPYIMYFYYIDLKTNKDFFLEYIEGDIRIFELVDA